MLRVSHLLGFLPDMHRVPGAARRTARNQGLTKGNAPLFQPGGQESKIGVSTALVPKAGGPIPAQCW